MLSILCVTLTIKVKVGIPESFKVGWYRPKITGSSHLKVPFLFTSYLLLRHRFVSSLTSCKVYYFVTFIENN